jgi:sporulation protein YlmC with PRC-barrel domain
MQKEGDMLISSVMRKEVLDKNANKIGLVVDINFNFPLWTINYMVVRMSIIKKINVGVEKIDKRRVGLLDKQARKAHDLADTLQPI